ncbi:BRO-A [Chrysodeixis includens nucleopolyhedrovirus]|uniref:BRO-A n=1 Tax=Chrysodeixis includens nucleopolyhedrovirus TaxID=1207438 RepID=A0A1C8ZZ63_9ABAC|nr:BRO-A [Chrysodeixis includens nucleopolyhedrovirus]AOL56611.1 BRO-A [Chrysodeixis includens nucleopolyhedrovirus]AOL56752.1 BRO-A [Chrysodeixis includens nucleopolyhedrovirus]AOL56894.1 BRO-A [Chrysodeixis includens nucleopolyhedrovirus]
MSLSKVNFAGRSLEVFTVVDPKGEKWHQANPFADALGYNNPYKAVSDHVSEENQKNYDCIESVRCGTTCGLTDESSMLPPSIQAKTKFINTAGVFELINASEMPAAKRFRTWENNDLLPTLCHEGEYNMAKFQFANADLEVISIMDDAGQLWFLANPFATMLNYGRPNDAIRNHVTNSNVRNYEYFRARRIDVDDVTLHPKSKFINRAGLFELIQASRMPRAQEFRDWINSDLLPKLCDKGEYSMAKDAPADIAVGMNAVHAATNDGAEAPWMRDLTELKTSIVEKDKKIIDLTVALKDSNDKLHEANLSIVTMSNNVMKAFEIVNEARKDCEMARKETADLANRMADIAQDVIAKPSDPQLLHSLAVCAMGGDQYAFLRPQKRSLKRSLERLSVGEKDIVFRRDYVPNSINVLNKVKERLPKDKYKAHNNRITLHDDLTKEDLLEAIESTVTSRQVAIIVNKANTTTNKNA